MLSSRCSHRNCVVRGDSGVGPVRGTLPRVLSRQKVCNVQCVTIQTGKPKLSYVGATFAEEGISLEAALWSTKLNGMLQPPRISKQDEDFLKIGVEFVESSEGIVIPELNDLFEKVNFPRRDPDKLKIALHNTHRLVWVRSTKQSRMARMGQMLGFARATSDGVLSATIWDVAVHPAWQRVGLGRAMMERLTSKLVEDDICCITLYAEPNVVGLYEKLGFVKDPDGIKGMAFQRKRKDK